MDRRAGRGSQQRLERLSAVSGELADLDGDRAASELCLEAMEDFADPVELMPGRKLRIVLAFDQDTCLRPEYLSGRILDAIQDVVEDEDLPVLTISSEWDPE